MRTIEAAKMVARPARIGMTLAGISILLAAIFLALLLCIDSFSAATYDGLLGLFNLNAEVSIPTWYSQILLFVASLAALVLAQADPKRKVAWCGLFLIFLFLSLDEGASVHELTTVPLRKLLDVQSGFFYYTWVVLYGLILAAFAGLYFKFWWNLPKRTKVFILASGVVFVLGAVGSEMIGGDLAASGGETSLAYGLAVAAEEMLEMLGVTLFIYALLDYFKQKKLSLRLTSE